MVYVLAVLTQIIGFFVSYSQRAEHDLQDLVKAPEDEYFMLNTCLDQRMTHWADWCTTSMFPGGFFLADIHRESNVFVIFLMTLILLLAAPFTLGLVTLWLI